MGISCKPFKCHHFASLSNKTIYYSQSVYSQKKNLKYDFKTSLEKKSKFVEKMCLSLYNARLRRNNQRDNFDTALKGMTILLDTLLARSNCNNHNCSIFSCRFFHLQTKITIPRINSISITKITPIAISVKKNDNSNIHLTSI